MKRSEERILTTHCGSVARPDDLLALIDQKEGGKPYDEAAYTETVRRSVADVVRQQAEYGLDVVNDGEQWRTTFAGYIRDRLGGFAPSTTPPPAKRPWVWARNPEELEAFPEYFERYYQVPHYTQVVGDPSKQPPLVCVGPVTYTGQEAVQRDIDNLNAALDGVTVEEAFLTASGVGLSQRNEFYKTSEEYFYAVADAMREEYLAIVNAGFVLQIDDPGLLRYNPELSESEGKLQVEAKIEALNYALRDIPEEQIRYHFCYGPALSPKVHDPSLADLIEPLLRVRAGAYSFEASNARHYHDYRVFESVKLPEGKIIIPGVLSHGANIVEHPEYIAGIAVNYANLVGKENVILANDCGFSSRALYTPEVDQRVAWAKFAAMVEGARLASKQLWKSA